MFFDATIHIPDSRVDSLDFLDLLLPASGEPLTLPVPDELGRTKRIFAQTQNYVKSRIDSMGSPSERDTDYHEASIRGLFTGKAVLTEIVDLYARALRALSSEHNQYSEARIFLNRAYGQVDVALRE